MEKDEEVEEEEERERMRKNTCDVRCLNFSKCRLATYVGLTSKEAITFIDTRKINT